MDGFKLKCCNFSSIKTLLCFACAVTATQIKRMRWVRQGWINMEQEQVIKLSRLSLNQILDLAPFLVVYAAWVVRNKCYYYYIYYLKFKWYQFYFLKPHCPSLKPCHFCVVVLWPIIEQSILTNINSFWNRIWHEGAEGILCRTRKQMLKLRKLSIRR